MKDNKYSFESKKIRVLIISDRLLDRAKALADHLHSTETVEVVGLAENKQQALSIAQDHSFDYLIIAGYLKTEYTYGVIAELQKQNKKFLALQWAILDSLIAAFCQRYKITLKFDRTHPITEFVSYLDTHKNDPIPSYLNDNSKISSAL